MRVELQIDPIACDGFGYCAELVPELIELDEWGFPIVRDDPLVQDVESVAREAVAQCPRRAISISKKPTKKQSCDDQTEEPRRIKLLAWK